METSTFIRLVDQIGIEALVGASPTQLPDLSEAEQDAVSQASAVVRVDIAGLETSPGQFWAFVQDDEIFQLSAGSARTAQAATRTLPDAAALLAEIEQMLPMGWMPQKAYSRAVLTRGDAEDVYDQIAGDDSITATEFLVSDGLTQEEAGVAFDAVRTASCAGRVSFMAVRDSGVELTYGIWIGQDGDDIWMVTAAPPRSDTIILETALEGAFRRELEKGWKSLGVGPD